VASRSDDEGAAFFREQRHREVSIGRRGGTPRSGTGGVDSGSQPGRSSADGVRGRYWALHNGEIYNFVELRGELERKGHVFRTTSDTEVILAAYAEWGVECFARFRGMWGLVLFDAERGDAILSRDRLGIKPLYTWTNGAILCVASEIKQFLRVPSSRRGGCGRRARKCAPDTARGPDVFRTHPLPAGTWCREVRRSVPGSPRRSGREARASEITDPREAGRLRFAKLRESVRTHLRSDVPSAARCWQAGLGGARKSCAEASNRPDSARRGDVHVHVSWRSAGRAATPRWR
jgi:asparagine synthase (glutamine-hydrolysing)